MEGWRVCIGCSLRACREADVWVAAGVFLRKYARPHCDACLICSALMARTFDPPRFTAFRAQMLSETRCLQKQLKNNFYVTHDQEEAMVISERWFAVRDTLNYIPD